MLEPAIQDKTRWWSREDIILLILLGALFFLPGLGRIPLFDRDEPRFAVAARTMAQTGDYIVPRFNGALRPDKPPLVYWLMNISSAAFGWTDATGELTPRIPSAVCGTLTLLVVYFMVGRRFGRVTGLLSALMLGSCAVYIVVSRMATADATMILFITLSMSAAWLAWDADPAPNSPGEKHAGHIPRTDYLTNYLLDRSAENPHIVLDHLGLATPTPVPATAAALFWIALAAGILTKGVPLLFILVPMLTLSLITRRWKWWHQLRPSWGIPLMILLVAWWVIWAGLATDWKLISYMVGIHFISRTAGPLLNNPTNPMRGYGQPPGFFLLTAWGTFWPWSILLIPAAYHTLRRVRGKTPIAIDPRPYQFLLAWIIPNWILLEISRGKLPHYILPTFIPLAILCADTLVQSWHRLTDVLAAPWVAAARWIILSVWTAMGAAVLYAGWRFLDHDLFWICIPFGGALVATGVATAIAWGKPSWPFVTALCWGGSLLCASSLLLPELTPIQVSRLAGRHLAELKRDDTSYSLAAAGYIEGTLVFYAQQDLPLYTDTNQLLKAIPFSPEGDPPPPADRKFLLAIDDRMLDQLDERKLAYYRFRRFTGFNPANQKPIAVNIITNIPPPPATRSSTAPATTTPFTPESFTAPATR